MKHLLFKLIAIAGTLFYFGTAHAQSPFNDEQKKLIEQIKKKMDETELGLIADADMTFGEAKAILETVSAEDIEIEKLFMKGSTPKAEKKAVNVKRNRIEAAKLYEKGYNMVFEACESRLKQITFPDNAKQTKSKEISTEANETMTGAITKGDDYKYLKDKDLETLRYDDLKSRIERVNKAFTDALGLEFSAWQLYFSQFATEPEPNKDSIAQADSVKAATETVASTESTPNTEVTSANVSSTESASDATPNNASETPNAASSSTSSKTAIKNNIITEKTNAELEAAKSATQKSASASKTETRETASSKVKTARSKASTAVNTAAESTDNSVSESSSAVKGTIFKVQLVAMQRKLSRTEKSNLYSGAKKLFEDFENGLYKYRVGDFSSQQEAEQFKAEYGKGCFIVKFVDGVRQ